MEFKAVFGTDKPIIGVVYLRGRDEDATLSIAREEVETMYRYGVDAVMVKNYFGGAWDLMRALNMLSEQFAGRVYGVDVLGDEELAFRLAHQYGAKFVRIDSVCRYLPPEKEDAYARKLSRMRETYPVLVLGGVRVKCPPVRSGRSLEEELRIGMERCDAIVVTGERTDMEIGMDRIRAFRGILGDFPLIVGGGMTPETAPAQLAVADGGIVGGYFKAGGVMHHLMDEARVARFMNALRKG